MNRLVKSLAVAGLMLHLQSPSAAPVGVPAKAVQNYLAPCFTAGNGVNCEVSGVARVGENLILANDKKMPRPGGPAIFTMALDDHRIVGTPSYLEGTVLLKADKFEGLTTTLDGKYVIAITAFNNPSNDALNTLLYWPVSEPKNAKVISVSTGTQVTNSQSLRAKINEAVGSSYYQIEAISTSPGDRLLIGIRKHGKESKQAKFSFLLLSISCSINEQGVQLGDQFEIVLSLTPDQLVEKLGMQAGAYPELGLSGLEFDRYNQDRLYAVTSYERDGKEVGQKEIGGFLWVLPFEGSKLGEPQPVRLEEGAVVAFNHKPEGVEVLDDSHVLIVHDDDRVRVEDPETHSRRQEHEFGYSVVTFGAE